MTARGLVLILDGLGDRPCPELGGLTPLEAADTPTLDRLAAHSQCGMMDPLLPGMPVDTHTGVGILFGLPPGEAVQLRRGPIEGAGLDGIDTLPGDVLMRANFAHVKPADHRLGLLDRRAGRIDRDVSLLCDSLANLEVGDGITASLFPATQHRAVLRLRGQGLSANISDTDPGGSRKSQGVLTSSPVLDSDAAAQATADAVNLFTEMSHEILAGHPVNTARRENGLAEANGVILRSAGVHRASRNLMSHLGLSVAVIAGERTIIGLARLCNYTPITDDRFTSLPDTDIEVKLAMAMSALEHHDLAYVHVKGTDVAAHDRNPLLKAELIGRIDRALENFDLKDLVVGVCADHSTDSSRGEHNGDAVPVLICHQQGRRDAVDRFGETACVSGALGRITAQGYLTSLLDAMGRLRNFDPLDLDFFQPGY